MGTIHGCVATDPVATDSGRDARITQIGEPLPAGLATESARVWAVLGGEGPGVALFPEHGDALADRLGAFMESATATPAATIHAISR